jgi:hypothetical protein
MKTVVEQLRRPIAATTLLAMTVSLSVICATRRDGISLFAEYARLTDYLTELPCRIVTNIASLPERMDPTCSESNQP